MSAEAPLEPHWSAARDRIRTLRTQARSRAWQAVYVEVVAAYREFGKGFDRSNLWNMRAFYLLLPILDALCRELTWTHYRLLLRVENPVARVRVGN